MAACAPIAAGLLNKLARRKTAFEDASISVVSSDSRRAPPAALV
jgi:hypothetical protein